MKVLLLIPALNEQAAIGPVVAGAKRHMDDVLVIDDGSRDETGSIAARSGAVVLRLDRNMGKGEALKAGFSYALAHGYDAVLTMDGDGQHDANDIPQFLQSAGRFDLILGNRMEARENVPWMRRAANLTSSAIVSALSGVRIHDSQTGFRYYGRDLIQAVSLNSSRYDLETEVIIKAARQGFRIGHCRIRTIYAGEVSRFRNFQDSLRFLRVVLRAAFRV